jgi:ribulose 1,5-bisphosphate synthetase/thiazole synthase
MKMFANEPLESRLIEWTFLFTRIMMQNPEIASKLPSEATVLILPKDDPEVAGAMVRNAIAQGANLQEAVFVEVTVIEQDHRVTMRTMNFKPSEAGELLYA